MTLEELKGALEFAVEKCKQAERIPNQTTADVSRAAWLWRRMLRIEQRYLRKGGD